MTGKADPCQKTLAIELEEVEPGFIQSESQASSGFKSNTKSQDRSDPEHLDSGCSACEFEGVCSAGETSEARVIKGDAATEDAVDFTQSQDSAFAKSDDVSSESVAVAEASPSPASTSPFLQLTKPGTANSENGIDGKEGSPSTSGAKLRKPTFVKSIRVTEETRFYPSTTSTPYHGNIYKPSTPRRIVHSVRPVMGITAVRLNRAYELRFTENHEKKILRDARRVSYQLYMSTARVLKRTPTVELGAGFP